MKKILFLFLTVQKLISVDVDLVVFSFDRAMQLYAFFESTEKYMRGLNKITLIYRSGNSAHDLSYNEVIQRFSNLNIIPIKQSSQPKKDFKPNVINALKQSQAEYIMFAVDDIIVTDYIDLNYCCDLFNQASKTHKDLFGFYFRMGKNITHCNVNTKSKLPSFTEFKDAFIWKLSGQGDWGYPNTVDLAMFKKSVILPQIQSLSFTNPNTFEAQWASRFRENMNKCGICFERSKMVNIPANVVQEEWKNPALNYFSADELLNLFNKGMKIDINDFHQLDINYSHFDKNFKFIRR